MRGESAAGGVVCAVPNEAVAGRGGGIARGRVADGEVEADGGVATEVGDIGVGGRSWWDSGVGSAVPGEAVADDGGGVGEDVVLDSEVEGIDLHTAVGVAVVVGVDARGCVGLVGESCPVEAVAGDGPEGHVVRAEDGEVEGVGARAGVTIVVGEEVGARCGVGVAIARGNPSVDRAGCVGERCVRCGVDSEVEGHGGVAAVGIEDLELGIEVATGGVGSAVPDEAIAGDGGGVAMGGAVDGEVEGYEAVAGLRIENWELRIEVAACSIVNAVPSKLVAGGGGGVTTGRVVESEVEGHGGVAAVGIEK